MKKKKLLIRILAVISGVSGVVILGAIIWPMISYDISNSKLTSYLSPVPQDNLVSQSPDFTKASNWFAGAAREDDFKVSNVSFYNISIPALKIDQATVAIGGEDLSKSLIQYPGTALPGKNGNAVIFGHSILPQFFNPKDYLAIFSTLPTIKVGDKVIVNYDGITFRYQVENTIEVSPSDIQVLEQDVSDSFLTLVTCVPPGHPLKPKRLVVRARLIPFGKETSDVSRN
ncbi:MAG: sortase [Patescibacteria group bacterium]